MAVPSSRTFSPPPPSQITSLTETGLHNGAISSRIVHKLAIEGRCSAEDEGASLRLFMKIVLPLDGLTPGASIPLFPEENVRIVNSKVQPLDSKSVPYAFSSTATPLLHKAARALNLPARSNKSYYTFLGIPPPTQVASSPGDPSSSRRAAAAAPLPLSVTGEINVSNFHICFILPRILPTRGAVLAENDLEQTPRSNRRTSYSEGRTILFMAGVEIFVPFISRPPKSPYQLSLPLPRCLSNHIKLRIMPPPRLPSGQESPPWDLTSEPAVTYKPSHGSRSISYEQMADDEDSLEDSIDSSTSAASSHGIQGTFPSSDRIRIRWAAPMNRNQGLGILADGRRRVGVEDGVGSLHCTILGRDEHERIKMRLEYEGTCKALWFPGVATQVGLDVVLDGKGRAISWASEDERWEISGGPGLTGYDGLVPAASQATPRPSDETESHIPRPSLTSTRLSSYGAPSLLQTALPTNSILPDYSFETTPSPTVSMINSTGTPYGNSSTSSAVVLAVAPTKPITLFLDISDLHPPPNNEFNFKVSGNILVGPHKDNDEKDSDEEIELPIFRILPAAKTRNQLLISSEIQQGIEVILPQEKRQLKNGMVNGIRTPPPRRKTLKRKSTIQADDGVCIIIPAQALSPEQSPAARLRTTPRTPQRALSLRTQRTPRTPGSTLISSPVVGGPHSIPWVRASVTLLPPSNRHSHAVQFSVPAVAVTDGVLSFGVCPPSFLPSGDDPAIEIVSATADGMSLQVEVITRAALEDEKLGAGQGFPFVDFTTASGELKKEEMSDLAIRDMDTWIRIVLPDERIFGNLDIQYLVARDPKTKNQKKSSGRSEKLLILLPAFHVGVGTYAVDFHHSQGFKEPILESNFNQQVEGRLTHYRLPSYFYPWVKATIEIEGPSGPTLIARSLQVAGWLLRRMVDVIPALASLAMLWIMVTIREDIRGSQPTGDFSWASQVRDGSGQQPPQQPGGTPAASPTFPYTVDTSKATPYNSAELDVARQVYSLMPLPLGMIRLDWARVADALLLSMEKLLGFLQAVLHYPTPP